MRDHILGTLYGMALGDAMGMPSELLSRRRIREIFGRIEAFEDSPAENPAAIGLKKGEFTDDTAQALVILDSLMENDYVPDKGLIARNLLQWAVRRMRSTKTSWGRARTAALHAVAHGEDPEPYTVKALTNGAAMRIAPIGCLFSSNDLPGLAAYVFHISEATHKTDVALGGAGMVAAAVSAALDGRSWDDIMDTAMDCCAMIAQYGAETYSASPKARLALALEFAQRYRADEEAFSLSIYEIIGTTTLMSEAVPAASGDGVLFQGAEGVQFGLCESRRRYGYDRRMAAAVCGAKAGAKHIEEELIAVLERSNSVDFGHYADSLLAHRGRVHC